MFVLIASSCSQDDEAMDAAILAKEINSELSAKGGKVSAAVAESFYVPNEICAGLAAEFCFTAAVGTNLQVQQLIAGEWVQVYLKSSSTSVNTCFPLTFATAGTYQLRYKIGGGGFSDPVTVTVTNCGCDEEFTYVDNGDETYTFTYIPDADAIGALVEFTFAQGVAVNGLSTNFTQNGGVSSVWSATMNLNECETYIWTVTLDANCSGNSPQSNVWTDFKVNSVSKKLDLEDKFTQPCR